MRRTVRSTSVMFILILFFFIDSCKKGENNIKKALIEKNNGVSSLSGHLSTIYPTGANDNDTIETPTIIDYQLPNPYTIANMTQAYSNMGQNITPAVTNLYVRFKPADLGQLQALDTLTEAQNLDLFDEPLDYHVVQEGDYYQDPSIPDEQITWQYCVVPAGFQFPGGIQYELLASIHIPTDVTVEAEAERLVGLNADGDDYGTPPSSAAKTPSSSSKTVTPYVLQCQPGYHWDFTVKGCVCNCCPTGYTWNGTQCVPPPPPPPPTAYVPTGVITVFDTQLDQGHNTGSSADWPYWRGVRNLNVIARRWFKVDKSYTDVNGHFNVTKNFRNKVKLIVKFKNSNASIRGVRGKRVWQMFYAIRKKIGKYTGSSINSVVYGFGQFPDVSSRGNRYWAGATTLNAVEEHKEYAALFTFSSAPTGMNIFLTNWAKQEGLASTPLFHKRFIQDLPTSFLNTYLVNLAVTYVAGGNAALLAVYARVNVDMAIDYHQPSLSQMTSDGLKETIYHELSHASHYTKVGTGWYTQFVNAELSEIVAHPSKNDPLSPYGSAGTAYAPIIALGEMWAYHMGHFLADQRYGIKGSCQIEQKGAISNCPGGNQHPHIDVLELFNPNFTTDPFYWIPKGLIQDLMDGGIEPASTTVTDNVNGFTILQVFTALQPDVNSIPLYKNRLLLQNNNAQLTQINSLFFSYGY